ncbi:3-carboxy-cis,cis-muconate cycloisomerase [Aureimonas pseudogalii]|nr:3-carboxy-cis,cis-muconate cycloisomerase [Aureimonas pseudogalii]
MPLLSSLAGDAEIAALFAPQAEIEALVRFEIALADAEAEAGLIERDAAAAIATALASFRPDLAALAAGLARDGVVVPDLVRQLREAVDEPHRARVHLGATSQDAIDTALMLRLATLIPLVEARLAGLRARLDEMSADQGDHALMAQTRMQAALPFTVAAKLRTWASPLDGHAARLAALREGLAIQLGGPIGDGSSFGGKAGAVRAALARHLGLADAEPWQSDRTRILDVAQALALVTGTLGKLGQDLALMAQTGIGTVTLTGSGGSSAMAHKQNPVGAEVLVALARFNAGMMGTLHQSMIHENERSGAAWTLEWMVLPPMAEAVGAALRHAAALLDGAVIGCPA